MSEKDEIVNMIVEVFNGLSQACYLNAYNKGFCSERLPCAICSSTGKKEDTICTNCNGLGYNERKIERNDGELIALVHSELGEALEALRHGNPASEHIPQFSAVEEEICDVFIRLFDICGDKKYRIGEAIVAKMLFNKTREHKHGKSF